MKYAPEIKHQFRSRQRPVGRIWRIDETYVQVKGAWKYLSRTVDKAGQTVDFLLQIPVNYSQYSVSVDFSS